GEGGGLTKELGHGILEPHMKTSERKSRGDTREFVAVPENAMGFVIGRKGSTIKQIEETSGAKITTDNGSSSGFIVYGTGDQRACARELINQKVANMPTVSYTSDTSSGQVVKIPNQFKKLVSGPGGDHLRNVSTVTGAEVSTLVGHQLFVTGEKKMVQHAEFLLRSKVASGRVKANKICVYIDERNLPDGCELKLVSLAGKDRMLLPGSQSQYRLKPVDEDELQGACALNHTVTDYDTSLTQSVLSSLRNIKMEIESKNYRKADMWGHLGKVIIRDPDEADVEETWSVADAVKKLQATPQKRNEWLVAFKEGVELDDKVVYDTFGEKTEEDFMARYDFSFLTPRSQSIRCKVWVANKAVKTKLEEIPIPFRDLKNVVEELRFEDEPTRARCRGWLALQSKKFLQANIIFPGSNVDCRISTRALTDDVIMNNSGVHEKEATHLLSQYLSKLTFTDTEGLRLPEENLPQGFIFNHWRCSRRNLYTPRPGFTMIVSREKSWCSDVKEEDSRETTDIHLHCEKWDQALSGEDWEPKMILAELPEFLQFVRQVQEFVSSNCRSRSASN
ncbi:hypothetical protein ACROYT_G042873, partial [Oculina patagonica]